MEAHIKYKLLGTDGEDLDTLDVLGHLVTLGLPKEDALLTLRDTSHQEHQFKVINVREFWQIAPELWRAEVVLKLLGQPKTKATFQTRIKG